MKKTKIIVSSSILILGCIILILLIRLKPRPILQLAIFPTGTSVESYYFEVSQDGHFKCEVGTRRSDNIKQPFFLKKVVESSTKMMDISERQILLDLAIELESSTYTYKDLDVSDSWHVVVLFNGKTYETDYFLLLNQKTYETDYFLYNHNDAFKDLINKIIDFSPILVDLHGWA